MPNHIHLLLYVEQDCVGFSKAIGEAKRFMAYEIIKRLKRLKEDNIIKMLEMGVQEQERKKGKLHQVFRLSFDAKEVKNEEEIFKVLDYMHHNPLNGKWQLVKEYIVYKCSSVLFYEREEKAEIPVFDFRNIISGSPLDDPEGF